MSERDIVYLVYEQELSNTPSIIFTTLDKRKAIMYIERVSKCKYDEENEESYKKSNINYLLYGDGKCWYMDKYKLE